MKVIEAFKADELKGKKLFNALVPLQPTARNKRILNTWTSFWKNKKVPYLVLSKSNKTNHGRYAVYLMVYKEIYVADSWAAWQNTTTLDKLMGG